MAERDVIVTGMGALSPMGAGIDALWTGLTQGRRVARLLRELPLTREQSRIGVTLPAHLRSGAATRYPGRDPVLAYALLAAQEAMTQAQFGHDALAASRTGIVIGTAVGGVISMEHEFRRTLRPAPAGDSATRALTFDPVSDGLYWQFNAFSLAHALADMLGARGLVTTMATGCTAGLDAIGLAMDLIACGECEVVLTGASEAPLTPIVITSFDNIGALSRRNDAPLDASRPFSTGRDGFVIGEGAAVLVLESRRHASARRATGLARLSAFSSRSNAFHMTSLHHQGADLAWCMNDALTRAGVPGADVGYINAHGTSTPQNDLAETNAIKHVLGARAKTVPVSSSKSMLGHSLGAAPALGACATIQTVRTGAIHPTVNLDPATDCDLDYVPQTRRAPHTIGHALCNASGFSGIHSSLLVSRM